MSKDELFAKNDRITKDFDFGEDTAAVFDDMLARSVPFYSEIERMISEMAADFAVEGTNVYDLGCSTCNTFLGLDPVLPKTVKFVGVDSSPAMLQRGREKLAQCGFTREYEMVLADLNDSFQVTNASVVIMNLVLMFVRPVNRLRLIGSIADGISPGGCLLLVEKTVSKDPKLNRLFIQHYYGCKERQGYSELEIAKKREALENVLIPYRLEEDRDLLLQCGFSECEVFFRWYNFCGLVAIK